MFTRVCDVTNRIRANGFSGNIIAANNFAARRLKFNESDDRTDCVSWHELVTANPYGVLLSSHTCTRGIPKNNRVPPNVYDEANHSLITRQV